MGKFSRITLEDRKKLEELKDSNLSAIEIAAIIKRQKNVVNQEYRRSGGRTLYNAENAQAESDKRKSRQENSFLARENDMVENYIHSVKSFIKQGKSFWMIKRALGINHTLLALIYKKLGHKNKSIYELLEEFEVRVEAMESSILYLIKKVGDSNGQ